MALSSETSTYCHNASCKRPAATDCLQQANRILYMVRLKTNLGDNCNFSRKITIFYYEFFYDYSDGLLPAPVRLLAASRYARGTRYLATVTDEYGFEAQAGRIICVTINIVV